MTKKSKNINIKQLNSQLITDFDFKTKYEPILINGIYYWQHLETKQIVEFYQSDDRGMVLMIEVDITK